MSKLVTSLLLVSLLATATCAVEAATQITGSITVTNAGNLSGIHGEALTVNGDTRTWTNALHSAATQILVNSTNALAAQQIILQTASYPFTGLTLTYPASTTVRWTALADAALTITLTGTNWGYVTLTTNTLGIGQVVRVPITLESLAGQTNVASLLMAAIASDQDTNRLPRAKLELTGTAGTYGDGTHYPIVTVDEHGIVTAITESEVSNGINPTDNRIPYRIDADHSGDSAFIYVDPVTVAMTNGAGSAVMFFNGATPSIDQIAADGSGAVTIQPKATYHYAYNISTNNPITPTPYGLMLLSLGGATSAHPEYSPAIAWQAFGWNTNAAQSHSVDFGAFVTATNALDEPTGELVVQSWVGTSDHTVVAELSTAGDWTTKGILTSKKSIQSYQGTLTHAGTVTLDFDGANTVNYLLLTGNVTVAFSNLNTNRNARVFIRNSQATNCTLTLPAGVQGYYTTTLSNGCHMLSCESWGTVDTNVWVSTLSNGTY